MCIKDWWKGKLVPREDGKAPKRMTNKSTGVFATGYYQRPLLAIVLEPLFTFYLKNWKWLWRTAIAVGVLYVGYLAIK